MPISDSRTNTANRQRQQGGGEYRSGPRRPADHHHHHHHPDDGPSFRPPGDDHDRSGHGRARGPGQHDVHCQHFPAEWSGQNYNNPSEYSSGQPTYQQAEDDFRNQAPKWNGPPHYPPHDHYNPGYPPPAAYPPPQVYPAPPTAYPAPPTTYPAPPTAYPAPPPAYSAPPPAYPSGNMARQTTHDLHIHLTPALNSDMGGGNNFQMNQPSSANATWTSGASGPQPYFCASASHELNLPFSQDGSQQNAIPDDCINLTEDSTTRPSSIANDAKENTPSNEPAAISRPKTLGSLVEAFFQRGLGLCDVQNSPTSLGVNDLQDKIQAVQSIINKMDIKRIASLLTQNKLDIKQTLEAMIDEVIDQMANQNQTSHTLLQQSMAQINQENAPENFLNFQPINHQLTPLHYQKPANSAKIIEGHGRRKALLIGINYLGTKNELQGCNADVRRIKNLLNKVFGFPDHPSSITILSDDECTDRRMYPTKRNILAACGWLIKNARAGDILFFHYSGHGSQKRNLTGTEADGYDETILPLDYRTAGQIRDNDLFESLVRPLPCGVKLICILDCCHSGSGMDLPYFWSSSIGRWSCEAFPKYSAGDVVLLSSCSDDETAADVNIPGMGSGGALSLGLISALHQDPFNTSFAQLMDRLYIFLRDRRYKQKPQLSSTQKFDLNQIKFNFVDILQSY